MTRSGSLLARLARVLAVAAPPLMLGACAGAGGGAAPAPEPEPEPTLRGDPAAVAAALAILEPKAAELSDAKYLEATIVRQEKVAVTGKRFTSEGPLFVRRDPATTMFRPGGARSRQILESPQERLVLDVNRKHATRLRSERNSRALLGVAALMLDLDMIVRGFVVDSVGAVPGDPDKTRIALVPDPAAGLDGIERLELIFTERRAVPYSLRVLSAGGGVLDYEILRATVDPPWQDPSIHFRLEIPEGYTVAEG